MVLYLSRSRRQPSLTAFKLYHYYQSISKMSDNAHIERLHTHEMELGATEAVQRHIIRHVVERRPISQRKLDFEHSRPRWLREMAAEATGVFFYGKCR
jgi:hypothetical protein